MKNDNYLIDFKDHKIISKPLIIEPIEFDKSIKKKNN